MLKIVFLVVFLLALPTNCRALELSAKSACLIIADSGEIIFEKDANAKMPMASTTKMMTALLAAESGKWEEIATVSANAEAQEGSRIYLEANDRIKLSDLVCGMLLNSGNDAAVAVAEHVSGDVRSFSELMCIRAEKTGAVNTSFENPSGLDGENHYSTAYDLAIIGSEVIKNPHLRPIIQSKEMKIENCDGDVTYLRNHNKLLWSYEGMIGVKTGFTKKSGRCLVSAAERNGITLVAVTLSAPDDWKDHKKLMDYGFELCEKITVIEKGEVLKAVTVGDKEVKLSANNSVDVVGIKNKREERELKISTINKAYPPINQGEKLGVAKILQNGKVIGETALVATQSVAINEKKGIWSFITKIFKK